MNTEELIYCEGCDSTYNEDMMEYSPEFDTMLCPHCI